jgi:hypothetical protein
MATVGLVVILAAAVVLASPVTSATSALAAPGDPNPPPIVVTSGPAGGTVGIDVHNSGSQGGGGGSDQSATEPVSDPCARNPTGTACAAYDHGRYCGAWAAVFLELVDLAPTGLGPLLRSVGCAQQTVELTPAVLAQQASGLLRLPAPTIERSPDAANSDHGVPYTWVNLWTWFWTSPATFTARSRTVSAGTVSATATATPTALIFDPGTGDVPVECPGPGRPWRTVDGNDAPADGGCGYRYRQVNTSVTATVSIRWTVTWTGSNGQSGQLPPLITTASSTFAVEQIQVVNR